MIFFALINFSFLFAVEDTDSLRAILLHNLKYYKHGKKKENSQGRGLKLYETFTVEREVNFSTGANCYLSRLEGGLILLDEDVIKPESGLMGAPGKKFLFLKRCSLEWLLIN
ncbi:MAG: hypothetical protein LUH01_17185 [Parabacteroides gordonii]|nr:hypothetical protein [Parabacteroides gordonii]